MDLSEYCEVKNRYESGVVISNKPRIVELPDGSMHLGGRWRRPYGILIEGI